MVETFELISPKRCDHTVRPLEDIMDAHHAGQDHRVDIRHADTHPRDAVTTAVRRRVVVTDRHLGCVPRVDHRLVGPLLEAGAPLPAPQNDQVDLEDTMTIILARITVNGFMLKSAFESDQATE